MSNTNLSIHYYSERGLVNCLINWLKYEAKDEDIKKFIALLGYDKNDNPKIDIYNEFSFGEFGSPDLIIKIDKCIYLIEVKIDTFKKSATSYNKRYVFKDNASKINIQLLLRKRFIEVLNLKKESIFEEESNYTYHKKYDRNGRALEKEELVDWAKNELMGDYDYCYVALVRNSEDKDTIYNDFFADNKYKFTNNSFKILSWREIQNSFSSITNFEETWNYTDKKFWREE